MRKWSKLILAIMLVAIALSVFVACSVKDKELALTFVSNEEQYATTIGIEQAKEILASQPSREGYVFKGWYLDKDTWSQEVQSDNLEEIVKDEKEINVYAYWVEIVDKITVSFRDYTGAILLEKVYERSDDQLAKDMASLRPSKRPDDEKYTYTYDKWECNTDDLTQGYFLATPLYDSQLRFFKFEYCVDGEVVYTDYVRYGEDADRDLVADPQKPSTEKYDYVFAGWEGDFNNVTKDTVVSAKFQENIKKFDVTFNFGNNKSIVRKVEYGADAIAPSESEVVKPSTAQYKYVFAGWDSAFKNIRQNTVVNANYLEQVRMYDVQFFVDNKCIKYENVPYGSSVEPPSQPFKDPGDGFTYIFIGWDKDFNNIQSNLDVHANFKQVSHNYTVNYENWDGSLLFTQQVNSGQPSTYDGEIPARQSNDKFDYVFTGWTDEDKLDAITRNITVQAMFVAKIKTFTVTFKYGDDKKSVFNEIEYGTDLSAYNLVPTDVDKSSTPQYVYEFAGWDSDLGNVTSNITINAKYIQSVRSYDVKFFVDDTCIKSVSVPYGSSVEAPNQPVKVENDGYTYKFIRWDKEFDNIVANTDVYAQFEQVPHTYTIQYINWDGELLYTDYVSTGGESSYVGETPQRESNDKFTYQFAGWTDQESLNNVTCSFATQAIFTEEVRTYTVTFNYGHGLQKVLSGIPYGTDLSADSTFSEDIPTDTQKSSTKQYDFTFIDWDKYFGYVSSDMQINAIYKETIRRYIVKFINNGVAILTQEVEYGRYPTLPTISTIKNHTVKWAFGFLGWQVLDVDTTIAGGEGDIDIDDGTDYRYTLENTDGFESIAPESTMVEGEITYTAIYSRTIKQYVVKFFNEENDQEALKEITVPWGTNVLTSDIESYQAPTPFKESVPKWDYLFTNWSKDLSKVEADISVYAEYTAKIRSYLVTFLNDGEPFGEPYMAEYDSVVQLPTANPTKLSTLEFDFEFTGWDRLGNYVIQGETVINAVYKDNLRYYVVTLFNLATYELISTGEFAYGTKITTKINFNGYDFDSWYRDPDCNTVFNQNEEFVDGPMMLFGNIVMKGLKFDANNAIVGYEGVDGAQTNLIIPIAANGKKVNTIKSNAFKDNTAIGSVFIPKTITKVEAYAFSGLNLTETGGIYVQANKAWGSLTKPSGWAEFWNRDGLWPPYNEDNRPVTYGVDGVFSVDNFQYMLFTNGTAYVDKFVNNTVSTAYIPSDFVHELAEFTSTVWTDTGKTEVSRDIYEILYTEKTYSVTQVAVSAFEGCTNLSTIFIPGTISKVGNYAFSGVTANVYIAKADPGTLSNANLKYGWGAKWDDNRSGQEGKITPYWDVIAMDDVGDFSYIFKTKGVAIAAEYIGSNKAVKTNIEVPGKVTYKDEEYTVEEIGDELLANMSLLNTVTIGEGVKKIGSKVFYMDLALKTVKLPSTLEEIGAQAFVAAMALNEIYIPSSVSKIGSLAFIGIDNLTIYCGKNTGLLGASPYATNIGWNTKIGFKDLGDLDLSNILKSLTTILGKFTQTHDVVYNVAGLPQTYSVGTALPGTYKYIFYNDGHAELIASNIPAGSFNTSYTIPSSIIFNDKEFAVTTIKASAFAGNTRIKELIIPASVTTIEANAFQGCSDLTIKTAHADKPSGWDSNFNPDGRNVEYSYVISASTESAEEVA